MDYKNKLSDFLMSLKNEMSGELIFRNIAGQDAVFDAIPQQVDLSIRSFLAANGISKLFKHQADALNSVFNHENVVITTGVSSGKSLCYQVPVVQSILDKPESSSLFLYPTKALSRDQLKQMNNLFPNDNNRMFKAFVYDGDTPADKRKHIRNHANIVVTNPDMLHMSILPHHTTWEKFFSGLCYVVIDEIHTYRGVFGSHFINVMRRLHRILKFYGASPQYIMTSATIANARETAEKISGQKVTLIDQDYSAKGSRYFIYYNPPIVNEELSIRKSSLLEAEEIGYKLIRNGLQSIIFAQTRKSVELIVNYLLRHEDISEKDVRGYRSGYLPGFRREIEQELQQGNAKCVVATNALELGIDIGSLDVSVISGYPGTIASLWQQAGRAGRSGKESVNIYLTSASPLDQYLYSHPEYIFDRESEKAITNPDHLLILFNHLQCAVFELPFKNDEFFGNLSPEEIIDMWEVLKEERKVFEDRDSYYWTAGGYPPELISLRNIDSGLIKLINDGTQRTIIGYTDRHSSYWLLHPKAIYIHDGTSYLVKDLNLEEKYALLQEAEMDYFTQAQMKTEFDMESTDDAKEYKGFTIEKGELIVRSRVTGFQAKKWYTHEIVGQEELEMPEHALDTYGCWIKLSADFVESLRQSDSWSNNRNNYGADWNLIKEAVRSRDHYSCRNCGKLEDDVYHDVHHIKPFRFFDSAREANVMENLITLCKSCHHQAESQVRVVSGLDGVRHLLQNMSPLKLMCDNTDIRVFAESASSLNSQLPAIVFYDAISGGIGLSEEVYKEFFSILRKSLEVLKSCQCDSGCPSCIGPSASKDSKKYSAIIINKLLKVYNEKS